MLIATSLLQLCAALLLALAVDQFCGEPAPRWHPVVWIGNYLNCLSPIVAPLATASPSRVGDAIAFGLGAAAWLCGAAGVVLVAAALHWGFGQLPAVLAVVLMAIALKPLLAWAMLRSEVQAVEAALGQSLEAGRARLAWLVSRDTSTLSATQVRESAIESLAENLNDSVIAPIFWFVLLGLPGAALYRFANTADAMWGYRGVRGDYCWEWAGKWAARADDVLSWLPARITALCIVLLRPKLWRALPLDAARTPSPNSGWPMAAMAGVLGVSLSKPGVYVLNSAGREPVSSDVARAIKFAQYAVNVVIAATLAAQLTAISWVGRSGL